MPGDEPAPSARLIAYAVTARPPALRRAGPRRTWMDELPERHANRCLPLVIANQLGWDVLNPASFRVTWNGGPGRDDLHIEWAEGHWSECARSAFGAGVLTFTLGYVFRTPPGVGLWVGGPPNWPADGITPLSGIVETDWSPTSFTMNYMLTRPGHPVEFRAGDPVCRLVPVDRHLVERLSPEIRDIADDPELARRHAEWSESRERFIAASRVDLSPAREQKWQPEYFTGKRDDWQVPADHQTRLAHREFVDLRAEPPAAPPRAGLGPSHAQAPAAAPDRGPQPTDYGVIAAAALLRDLTERQRREVLRGFCSRCGREDPRCGCP